MRALHVLHSSLLDFIENTRWGSLLFRAARFGLFAMLIFVGSKVAAGQFLGFDFHDVHPVDRLRFDAVSGSAFTDGGVGL